MSSRPILASTRPTPQATPATLHTSEGEILYYAKICMGGDCHTGIKFFGVFNFVDFVRYFSPMKLICWKYSLRMCGTCTSCMWMHENVNLILLEKLRAFYKAKKNYTLENLYPYGLQSSWFHRLSFNLSFILSVTPALTLRLCGYKLGLGAIVALS